MTQGELLELKALFHTSARVFSLIPIPAVAMALATYGPTDVSEELLSALGLPRPTVGPTAGAHRIEE